MVLIAYLVFNRIARELLHETCPTHRFMRIDFEEKFTTQDATQIRIPRIKSNCKTIEN